MKMEVEKLIDGKEKCNTAGCNESTMVRVTFKKTFKHKICLCKKCLKIFYGKLGRNLTPSSPKNMIKKSLKEENYE